MIREETGVKKDLEWLKNEVNELPLRFLGFSMLKQREEFTVSKDDVLELINQLDEPETLSQKWIDEHKFNIDTYDEVINVDDLQNLLVPKQEELEAKIQELIETYKREEDAYSNPENGWISGFIEDLKNLAEEEQKYYVILEENSYGAMGLGIGREGRLTFTATHDKWSLPKLTEQEIKDYDERFWPFAVKVEELEE